LPQCKFGTIDDSDTAIRCLASFDHFKLHLSPIHCAALALPDNISREQIPAMLGSDGEDHIYALLTSWEALGILLYRKEVSIDLVDDFFSGPIVVSWRKLSRYIAELRRDAQRDTYFEWVQWLAERMMEREKQTPPVPAHIAHHDWQ
jgi:hypothetical protein